MRLYISILLLAVAGVQAPAVLILPHAAVYAQEPGPSHGLFEGTVILNGMQAPDGTLVLAIIAGEVKGDSTVLKGKYELWVDRGKVSEVSFKIGGKDAVEKGQWSGGNITVLNLSHGTEPNVPPFESPLPALPNPVPKVETTIENLPTPQRVLTGDLSIVQGLIYYNEEVSTLDLSPATGLSHSRRSVPVNKRAQIEKLQQVSDSPLTQRPTLLPDSISGPPDNNPGIVVNPFFLEVNEAVRHSKVADNNVSFVPDNLIVSYVLPRTEDDQLASDSDILPSPSNQPGHTLLIIALTTLVTVLGGAGSLWHIRRRLSR